MFETSVLETRAVASQRHFGFLTLSVAAHSAVIVALIVISLQSAEFPKAAPDEVRFVQLVAPVTLPPPLGTPDGAKKPNVAAAPPERRAVPLQVVAPNVIPTDITPVEPSSGQSPTIGEGEGEGEGVFGDPNGVPGGIDIGQTPSGPVTDVIHQPGGEVRAASVIRRVDPIYPRVAIAGRKDGIVRLRCIIDKSGRIRDPEVIFSSFAAFNQPALDAVRQWTFAPGVLRGQPVDTWFELTITFRMR